MNVYVVAGDGSTEAMDRLSCKNEARELHDLIENNLDLVPGDQINPTDPRRWVLIRREMPVPDPSTGSNRWSVDLLLADQDAVPTFVECKRFGDTRARREILGQLLEYAANGHLYWSRDVLQTYAEEVATGCGQTLEEALLSVEPADEMSPAQFFERMEDNLREGQVRLVFVLEESPFELRSVVNVLNRQMERSEVLLVELRQFERDGVRIVVPSLFGYTEEARQVKRTVTVASVSRRKWDRASFFEAALSTIGPDGEKRLRLLCDGAIALQCEVTWGTGVKTASYNVKEPAICSRSLISALSDGSLSFCFGWLKGTPPAERLRDRMKDMVVDRLGLAIPDDYARKWPSFQISEWGPKVDELVHVLKDLLGEFRGTNEQPRNPGAP